MAQQLTFDLPVRAALGRGDFFVSDANAAALAAVDAAEWAGNKLLITGPRGSGKTHLVHVWAESQPTTIIGATTLEDAEIPELASAARIAVEDIDRIAGHRSAEEALFHLHNLSLANGSQLLMTGRDRPESWPLILPDLASRLGGTDRAVLHPPDDALLGVLMMKLFADRQLRVAPDVLAYLMGRMDRSFAGTQRLVQALDAQALTEKRAVTRALAAKVLDNQGPEAP